MLMPGRCMGTVKLMACGGGLNALSGVLRDASMTIPWAAHAWVPSGTLCGRCVGFHGPGNLLDGAATDTESAAIRSFPLLPAFKAARISCSLLAVMAGRPKVLPCARARGIPAIVRVRIIDFSNSANAPVIWNINFPAGVVVSIFC